MFRLISDKRFDGFGPCGLSGDGEPQAVELAMPPRKAAARNLLRRECPRQPGVYGMIDAEGKLIYIGKSKTTPRSSGGPWRRARPESGVWKRRERPRKAKKPGLAR